MSVESVTYDEAKKITLEYYVQRRDGTPLPLRDVPRKIVANQALSLNAIIAHIESNTEIGQWLVGEYIASLGLVLA